MYDCCKSEANIIAKPETEEDIAVSLLRRVSTDKLVSELIKRHGVEEWTAGINDAYNIRIARMDRENFSSHTNIGPARIIIIKDW